MYFSVGGLHYNDPPLEFQYTRDSGTKTARFIIIPIEHRVGRYVKFELFFDARWLLISEVHFESGTRRSLAAHLRGPLRIRYTTLAGCSSQRSTSSQVRPLHFNAVIVGGTSCT